MAVSLLPLTGPGLTLDLFDVVFEDDLSYKLYILVCPRDV